MGNLAAINKQRYRQRRRELIKGVHRVEVEHADRAGRLLGRDERRDAPDQINRHRVEASRDFIIEAVGQAPRRVVRRDREDDR